MDEAVIRSRLFRDPPRRDPARADLDEQPLGGIEQRLLGLVAWAGFSLRHTT